MKYLESRLIDLANLAKRAHLQNTHASLAPQLSEVDVAKVENFLAEMLHLIGCWG